jgi:hypothetical protein
VPRVQLIYLAFPALPLAPLLAQSFRSSTLVTKQGFDIYRNSLVHADSASILQIIRAVHLTALVLVPGLFSGRIRLGPAESLIGLHLSLHDD